MYELRFMVWLTLYEVLIEGAVGKEFCTYGGDSSSKHKILKIEPDKNSIVFIDI